MKRLTRFLFLFLFTLATDPVYSQTKLTEFDNQVPYGKFKYSGVELINGDNYLIEVNESSLRVSLISDDVQVLYEVSDYPLNDQIHSIYGRFNTRSRFFVEGEFLFEIFKSQIRKRNLITSEIVEVYSFPNSELISITGMNIIDDIIHFDKGTKNALATYNISTAEFIDLPFQMDMTYRSGHIYYSSTNMHGVTEYNAIDKTTQVLFENELNVFTSINNSIAGSEGLIFGSPILPSTRFINQDTTFLIPCELNFFFQDLFFYETNEHYVTLTFEDKNFTIQKLNKSNCSVDETLTYPRHSEYEYIKVFNTPTIEKDYLLFAFNFGSFISAQLMLLDKNTSEVYIIDSDNIQNIIPNNFYTSGNTLYFFGHDASEPYPPYYSYSVDLTTKEFAYSQSDFCNKPISFSPSRTDSTYILSGLEGLPLCIHKFKSKEDFELFHKSADTRNAGLTNPEYLGIQKDILVFRNANNLYLADNNSIENNVVNYITSATSVSNVIIDEQTIQGLLNENDTTYHFNYEYDSDSLYKMALEDYTQDFSNSFILSNYIFGTFSTLEKKYYDIELKEFKPIPINGTISSIHKSNKNALFLVSNDQGYSLTSFIEGQFIDFPSSYFNKPDIFSKNNGEFFILPNKNQLTKEISIVKSDGSLGDQINPTGNRKTSNQSELISGPLSVFMYYSHVSKEFQIIMHRYNNFHLYKIPFDYNPGPITSYKVGNSIVFKSESTPEPGIYVCTFGKGPKKLELNDVGFTNYELLFATHKEGIISFMVDSSPFDFEIVQYDTQTESIAKTDLDVPDDFYYDWYTINSRHRISPNLYYIVFPYQYIYEEYENKELYIFDADALTFDQEIDLNLLPQESNPHRFISSSSHLYFMARSPADNSYQLFVKEKDEITSVIEVMNEYDFKVSPNPSSDFISIGIDADVMKIYDPQGIELKSIDKYMAGKKIDISQLKSGIYIMESLVNNQRNAGTFIKI